MFSEKSFGTELGKIFAEKDGVRDPSWNQFSYGRMFMGGNGVEMELGIPVVVSLKFYLNARERSVREVLEKAFPTRRWMFDRGFAVGVQERLDARTDVPAGRGNWV